MTPEQQAAHFRTAYDLLKNIYIITVMVLCFVILVMTAVVYDARKSIELNTQRYNEMREAYEIQTIYFNNMKARIEALNQKAEK